MENYYINKIKSGHARKHHLDDTQLKKLLESSQENGVIPNPYRIGSYWGQVQSLIELGVDEWHPFVSVFDKMKTLLRNIVDTRTGETKWDTFVYRCGTSQRERSLEEKVMKNFELLQRVPCSGNQDASPYGVKLAQLGMCVDIQWKTNAYGYKVPYYRLRTGEVPYNMCGNCELRPLKIDV